jgi:hypothetical protein
LAHDVEPELRRRAVAFMGESGDRVFLPTLITMLDDPTLGVRKTTVDALVALVGSDVAHPAGEQLPALNERAARWRTWYERQPKSSLSPARAAAAGPAGPSGPGPLERGETVVR